MFDKNFEEITQEKMEMFSSFFTTIKSFIREIVLKGDNDLKAIEMGTHLLTITSIKKLNVDLVIIADKEDDKKIKKIMPDMTKILTDHAQLFVDWNGDAAIFKVMDKAVMDLINKTKGLSSQDSENLRSLVEHQSEILHSIWENNKIDPQQRQILMEQREGLIRKLSGTNLLLEKTQYLENILELDRRIGSEIEFLEDQNLKIKLDKELADIKLKMKYFLKQSKDYLNQTLEKVGSKPLANLNYGNTFTHLYSFGGKLKAAGKEEEAERIQKLAKILMDRHELNDKKLSEAITQILKLNDDINSYLK